MNIREKYRPKSLNDIVFANPRTSSIVAEYIRGNLDHHLLLYGPQGAGKSEIARLIAEAPIRGGNYDQLHGCEADKTLCDRIGNTWALSRFQADAKVCYIIDEVDQLPDGMEFKVRALLDRRSDGILICTTNNIHKLTDPFIDRMTTLKIDWPSGQQWVDRAHQIIKSEVVECDRALVEKQLQRFDGSGREMMTYLEKLVKEARASLEAIDSTD